MLFLLLKKEREIFNVSLLYCHCHCHFVLSARRGFFVQKLGPGKMSIVRCPPRNVRHIEVSLQEFYMKPICSWKRCPLEGGVHYRDYTVNYCLENRASHLKSAG